MHIYTKQPDLHIYVSAEPELDIDLEGSFDFGNEEENKEYIQQIKSEIESGNEWAWCQIALTIEYYSTYMATNGIDPIGFTSYLGGCSYTNFNEFYISGCYAEGMLDEAADGVRELIKSKLTGSLLQSELQLFNSQYEKYILILLDNSV